MATLPTPAPTRSLVPHREWNTPEILTRSRAALFGLTALLLTAIVAATATHHDAMQLVGRDTAPSIIHAQRIKTALAAMDADAADDLLNPGSTRASGAFERHRIEADDALMDAAKNVTFETEKEPIKTLEEVTGKYEQLVQEARDWQESGQPETATTNSGQHLAVQYYRASAIVMDGTLLPAADALDKANNDQLTDEYDSRATRSLLMRLLVVAVGLVTLAALVAAQLYLSRRMRRTLNPGLLAATFVALALTVYSFAALQTEQNDLREARSDAFQSVHALLQARAIAYSANSDESRALLDPAHAAEYQSDFNNKADRLMVLPLDAQGEALPVLLRTGKPIPGFTGLLADELNNITYVKEGEQEAADNSVLRFADYLAIDKRLQKLVAAGHPDQAIALDTGTEPGQSDYAFTQFDQALGQALDINQTGFDHAVTEGFDAIRNLNWIALAAGIVIATLIFFGFAPRIREYQ